MQNMSKAKIQLLDHTKIQRPIQTVTYRFRYLRNNNSLINWRSTKETGRTRVTLNIVTKNYKLA